MSNSCETPCIGICSTIYGDEVCLGCLRRFDEVIDWNQYQESDKKNIIARIYQLVDTVMAQYFTHVNENVLDQAIQPSALRLVNQPSAWFKAYRLLRDDSSRFESFKSLGLSVAKPYQSVPVSELIQQLCDEIYQCAFKQYQGRC